MRDIKEIEEEIKKIELELQELKEEAEEYREYIKVKKEYSTEFTTKEWEDRNITKYYIYLDYPNKKLYPSCNCCFKYMNATYFTEENVEKFIEKYEKQILKYEFGIGRK